MLPPQMGESGTPFEHTEQEQIIHAADARC